MQTVIAERLNNLREVMRREHLAAFIFPSSDPHNSEYVPDYWKGREWISGFNGSAGTAVVTMNHAALWTDSRYFIAAADQLSGTEYQLMKLSIPGTPSVAEWLADELKNRDSTEIGIDGWVNTYAFVEQLKKDMRERGGITVRTNFDPLQLIWKDRPALPKDKIVIQPLSYAGERTLEKITRIRKALRIRHADGTIVSALDDIAWILNLRGNDVHCNPVFVSYLIISTTQVTLFVDQDKLSADVVSYLKEENISIRPYVNIREALKGYAEYNILLDPYQLNHQIFLAPHVQDVIAEPSPVAALKAIKNSAEIDGFRRAMRRDGVAMVKFLKWLKPAVESRLNGRLQPFQKFDHCHAIASHSTPKSIDLGTILDGFQSCNRRRLGNNVLHMGC